MPAAVVDKRPDARLWLSMAAVYVIWGSTYYAMRVAVAGLPPLLMGALRFVVAGGALLAIARAGGAPWPTRAQWARSVPVGILFFIGGNGFVAIAETSIDSGVAAVVCATMPLWTALLVTLGGERPSGREWLGLAIGFGGVVVLVGGAWHGADPAHLALLILSPLSWAIGSMLSRKLPVPGVSGSALQMITGGLALSVVAFASGESMPAHVATGSWLALAYLIVFGSLVGFSAFGWLLRNTRPAVATSYAYVNPAIAVLVGAIVGGETIGLAAALGAGLIVAAVALVVSGRKR